MKFKTLLSLSYQRPQPGFWGRRAIFTASSLLPFSSRIAVPQQGKLSKDLAPSLHFGDILLVGQCRKNHILAICATSEGARLAICCTFQGWLRGLIPFILLFVKRDDLCLGKVTKPFFLDLMLSCSPSQLCCWAFCTSGHDADWRLLSLQILHSPKSLLKAVGFCALVFCHAVCFCLFFRYFYPCITSGTFSYNYLKYFPISL